MMTLRQVEVVRAVMVTGTIEGAAKLLNVSAPGISRLVKYTEKSLGIRFFQRQNGRYSPTPEARSIFEQINGVYKKVDDLTAIISKIELGKGECVTMNYRLDHSALDFAPLAAGELFCVVPEGHELAERAEISAAEMTRYPLIGIDPNDPYGRIMAAIFARHKLAYDITIKARFGTTVCALVKAGLGIAIIDQFTVAHGGMPGIKLLRIVEPTPFDTFVAMKRGAPLSQHVEYFIECLRAEMRAVGVAAKKLT